MREECVTDDTSVSTTSEELQDALCEVIGLQARLARMEEENSRLKAQLTAASENAAAESLSSCCATLMPADSRREQVGKTGAKALRMLKLAAGNAWAALTTRLALRRDLQSVDPDEIVASPAWRPSAAVLALSKDNLARREEASNSLSTVNDGCAAKMPADSGAIPYAPMSWQRVALPASVRSPVNLAVIALLHRSGSTLLQRICNARRTSVIWGEHNAMLAKFTSIYQGAARFCMQGRGEREQYFQGGENPNLWIANMCPDLEYLEEATVNSARALLDTFYQQYRELHDVVGFKEVQYGRAEVELLRTCCPEAKVLLLVRHPFSTWNSTPRGWYPSLEDWAMLWNKRAGEFVSLAAADPQCHLIRYEDLVRQDPDTVKTVMSVAQVTRKELYDVLGHKIGSHHVGLAKHDRQVILTHCRDGMSLLGYDVR